MPSHKHLVLRVSLCLCLSLSQPQACDMSQVLWAYYKTVINAFNLWFVCGYSEDCRQEILLRLKPELSGKCEKSKRKI